MGKKSLKEIFTQYLKLLQINSFVMKMQENIHHKLEFSFNTECEVDVFIDSDNNEDGFKSINKGNSFY